MMFFLVHLLRVDWPNGFDITQHNANWQSMQYMPSGRSKSAPTAVVSVLGMAALLLLGLVLAYWTWTWFGPHAEPRVETNAGTGDRLATASGLFGRAERSQANEAPTGLSIELVGAISATNGAPGYALVRLDAKQTLAVRAGEDIAPGVRLEEVLPDHVILERNGTRETLALPEQGKSTPPPTPAAIK